MWDGSERDPLEEWRSKFPMPWIDLVHSRWYIIVTIRIARSFLLFKFAPTFEVLSVWLMSDRLKRVVLPNISNSKLLTEILRGIVDYPILEQVDTHTHCIVAFGYGNFKRVILVAACNSSLQVERTARRGNFALIWRVYSHPSHNRSIWIWW